MGRIRVLLADDHEAMLDRVADLLAGECDVIGTAIDGRQALDAAQNLKPDVLVLDISMPVMNGIETARCLKEVGVETRIAPDLLAVIKEAHDGRSFVSPHFRAV